MGERGQMGGPRDEAWKATRCRENRRHKDVTALKRARELYSGAVSIFYTSLNVFYNKQEAKNDDEFSMISV